MFARVAAPTPRARLSTLARAQRAEVLLGGQIIEPLGGERCRLTTVGHINPGGTADSAAGAAIINAMAARDPVVYIEGVRRSARNLESARRRHRESTL